MGKREYLPLQIAQQMINQEPEIKKYFRLKNLTMDSLEDYISFMLSEDFLNPTYSGNLKNYNNFCLSILHAYSPLFHEEPNVSQFKIEVYDYLVYPAVISLWEKTKKVYKLDSAFFEELCHTNTFEFPETSLKYLPYPTFYIDLSDCKVSPIKGVFVHTVETKYGLQPVMYMVSSDTSLFSFYGGLIYNKDRVASIEEQIPDTDFSLFDPRTMKQTKIGKQDRRGEIVNAVFQIMMFLSSTSPDIKENSETQKTYRPSPVVRNKFSEIQMWDVGVRYGRAIRFAKKEEAKSERQTRNTPEQRKPVRPHVRCAHWQRFHVGKGRAEIRIKWIPPVFVCGNREIPVTIHEISL